MLSGVYEWSRDEIAETLAKLLTVQNLVLEDEGRIRGALKAVRLGADLSDAFIAAACERGCRELATFDKGSIKQFPSFTFSPK